MNLEALDIKPDTRGMFVEAFKLPHDGQVAYLVVYPTERRGNHYHLRKTEHFLVVNGSAVIVVKNRDTNDVMKVELTGQKPMVATISPNHTHYIEATNEGCIALIWCDEQFNEEDSDTYPEEV